MAEYSKQYVENYMPEWTWDFDIEEEFDKLQPGEFVSVICEGFGFYGLQEVPYKWLHKAIKDAYKNYED